MTPSEHPSNIPTRAPDEGEFGEPGKFRDRSSDPDLELAFELEDELRTQPRKYNREQAGAIRDQAAALRRTAQTRTEEH